MRTNLLRASSPLYGGNCMAGIEIPCHFFPESKSSIPIIHAPSRPGFGLGSRRGNWLLGLVLAGILSAGLPAKAIHFTSVPQLTPASQAPLAAQLSLETDVPSRVSVSIQNGGQNWTHDFLTYSNLHNEILLGFTPGTSNVITVRATDQFRNSVVADTPVILVTDPLPAGFPTLTLNSSEPALMEPGYTLFRVVNNDAKTAYVTMVDNAGEVVWYSTIPSTLDVRQLPNGNLFLPLTTNFVEVDLLGQQVNSWAVPTGMKIDFHDGVPTSHGTILYLYDDTTIVNNFPTSATNPNAPPTTAQVEFNRVLELSMNSPTLVGNWSLIDLLQPNRIDYLTFSIYYTGQGWDTEHANAVIEDPRDNSIIVSMRHQDAVVKFTRDGQLKWILGTPANWSDQFSPYLLKPVGTPFEWSYAQHAPMLTPHGTLLIYDDGNYRASPYDTSVADINNYSRAVEYSINEETMEVSQVWDFGRTNATRIYTDRVGNADWLPRTGNVLVHFGNVDYIDGAPPNPAQRYATIMRVQEVTHGPNPEVVFDLTAGTSGSGGAFAYRSHRIPDLYGHPVLAVTDLMIEHKAQGAVLRFSGDNHRNYLVQASIDLRNWETLGTPNSEGAEYDFTDASAVGEIARYYRVLSN